MINDRIGKADPIVSNSGGAPGPAASQKAIARVGNPPENANPPAESDSPQSANVFPRNSWQSPEAQMRELTRAQNLMERPYNYRSHPGMALLDDLPRRFPGWNDQPAQPVYGAPADGGGTAQPVYGAPIDGGGGTAQPVYGAPVQPRPELPADPDPVVSLPRPRPGDGVAQPVYGAPVGGGGGVAQPVYGAPVDGGGGVAQPVYGAPLERPLI